MIINLQGAERVKYIIKYIMKNVHYSLLSFVKTFFIRK